MSSVCDARQPVKGSGPRLTPAPLLFLERGSVRNYQRVVLFALVLLLACVVAYQVRGALLLIYVSTVFAVVLSPVVERVHRLRLWKWQPGRGVAMLLSITATLAAITVFLLFALPPIITDIQEFTKSLPEQVARLRVRLANMPYAERINLDTIGGVATKVLGGVPGVVGQAAQTIVSVVTVVILTAYLILDGRQVFDWCLSLVPDASRERLRGALLRAGRRMRNWLVGQALLMLILGSLSAVVFGLLGIRYFFALAVFAGLANVVPLLGPVITVILASLVAATDSFSKVLGVWIFYFVYQQLENAFLTPRIMQAQVELSATAVVVALLIGGELAGIPGALVAVPSAVLVAVLADEYLVKEADLPVGAG